MNKKIKKNLTMIVSLSGTGVVALGLLIYVVILFFDWSSSRDLTIQTRNKVQNLVKSKPAPGRENEARIQKDIDLYEEKGKGLVDNFKSPLRPAVDAFIAALPAPIAAKMSDEEKETYKVPHTGIEGDEDTPAVPLQIRKLTYEEFITFFNNRFEKYCSDNNITEDTEKFSLSVLEQFSYQCRELFPTGSWNHAMEKFRAEAENLTYEVINDATQLPILLYGFGFPRRVDRDIRTLRARVDDIISLKIRPIVADKEEFFADGALDFVGGGTFDKHAKPAAKDYPAIFFHWDVFGDIVKRLNSAKVSTLQQVILRKRSEEGASGSGSESGSSLAESFEQDGNYKLYHYTLVFSGTMNSIRDAIKEFDSAWKGNKDGKGHRMYIVRGLALYASENGAGDLMNSVIKSDTQKNNEPVQNTGRRRRRQAQQNAENFSRNDENSKTPVFKPLNEVSESEARKRYYDVLMRLRKEKEEKENPPPKVEEKKADNPDEAQQLGDFGMRENSEKQLSEEEKAKKYDEFEKSLQMHEKFGYAAVVVGEHADDCIVYLDVDYVVLEQNQ